MKKALLVMGLILGLCSAAFAQEDEDYGSDAPVWTDDSGGGDDDTYIPPGDSDCEGDDCQEQ